jgi:hypothetical protein
LEFQYAFYQNYIFDLQVYMKFVNGQKDLLWTISTFSSRPGDEVMDTACVPIAANVDYNIYIIATLREGVSNRTHSVLLDDVYFFITPCEFFPPEATPRKTTTTLQLATTLTSSSTSSPSQSSPPGETPTSNDSSPNSDNTTFNIVIASVITIVVLVIAIVVAFVLWHQKKAGRNDTNETTDASSALMNPAHAQSHAAAVNTAVLGMSSERMT